LGEREFHVTSPCWLLAKKDVGAAAASDR